MVGKLARANDQEGEGECFSQQAEVENFLTCRVMEQSLSLFPFAPDTLFTDEEPLSFSSAIFTAHCSLMTLQEQTYLQLKGVEIMMKSISHLSGGR